MPVTKAVEKMEEQQNHFDFNIIYKAIPKPNKLKSLNMQLLYVNRSKVLSRMTRRLLLIVQTYLVSLNMQQNTRLWKLWKLAAFQIHMLRTIKILAHVADVEVYGKK